MLVQTKAIVLTSLKYGESDLIVRCMTEEGVKSYLLRRVFSSRNKKISLGYFQPLSLLDLTANHNAKGRLNSLKEVRISYLYQSISTDILKQSIALFLAEVLTSSIREEEANPDLFQYVETALIWLDTHSKVANFHLLFLFNLTRFLGFYPDTRQTESQYFDLVEGSFSGTAPVNPYLDKQKLVLFKSLIGIKFDDVVRLKWNSEKRTVLIEILLKYYEFHLPGFKKPRSLNVLKEVFNEVS